MAYTGPEMTGRYLDLLAEIHRRAHPRTYLEIGMRTGDSLALASPETIIVGIDPCATVRSKINADARLFFETSDDFFAGHDVRAVLDGNPIDLAFIDGMHLFEFALRDFRNVEAAATPESVVLIHDCLPTSAAMATRERGTAMWTGDTWKLVCILREFRPDLDVRTVAVKGSGLGIVRNLDPANRVLHDRYDEAVERFMDMPFDHIEGHEAERLNVIPNDPDVIAEMIPAWPALAGRTPQPKRYPISSKIVTYNVGRIARGALRRVKGAAHA